MEDEQELEISTVLIAQATNRIAKHNSKSQTHVIFAKEKLFFKDPFYSNGRDIVIVADSLGFSTSGFISSGFQNSAKDGSGSGKDGSDGRSAGSITVIAKHIHSLRITSQGQSGGDGRNGADGANGRNGSNGQAGRDARCRNTRGTNGAPGGNGTNGQNGGDGGDAGSGGSSGDIVIQYVHSDIDFGTIRKDQINIDAGEPGNRGSGGRAGRGGKAGRGGAGGKSEECWVHTGESIYLPGGDKGADGSPGSNGSTGRNGARGRKGSRGNLTKKRLKNDEEYYVLASRYLPEIDEKRLRQAELLYLLNRETEAKIRLGTLAKASKNKEIRAYATVLLERIDAEQTYFGRPKNWAQVIFHDDGEMLRPATFQEIEDEYSEIVELVRESEKHIQYRRSQVYEARRASNAVQFELIQIGSEQHDLRRDIENFERTIDDIVLRLDRYSGYLTQLQKRYDSIHEQLIALGAVKKDVLGIITDLSSAGASGAQLVVAVKTGQWMSVPGSLGGVLKGLKGASDKVKGIRKTVFEFQKELFRTQDQIFFISEKISGATHEVAQARSNRSHAIAKTRLLNSIGSDLEELKFKQDESSLARLYQLSLIAHQKVTLDAAGLIDRISRYVDLRSAEMVSRKPISMPTEGIDAAFGSAHLRSLQIDLKRRLSKPPAQRVKFEVSISREDYINTFEEFNSDELPQSWKVLDFEIPRTVLPGPFRGARVRKLELKFLNGEGNELSFSTVGIGNQGPARIAFGDGDGVSYSLTPSGWWWTPLSASTFTFAFRPLEDLWNIQFPDIDRISDLDRIQMIVDAELPPRHSVDINIASTEADDSYPISLASHINKTVENLETRMEKISANTE